MPTDKINKTTSHFRSVIFCSDKFPHVHLMLCTCAGGCALITTHMTACAHTHMRARAHTHTHTHTCMHECTHTHTCMHECTHTHAHSQHCVMSTKQWRHLKKKTPTYYGSIYHLIRTDCTIFHQLWQHQLMLKLISLYTT